MYKQSHIPIDPDKIIFDISKKKVDFVYAKKSYELDEYLNASVPCLIFSLLAFSIPVAIILSVLGLNVGILLCFSPIIIVLVASFSDYFFRTMFLHEINRFFLKNRYVRFFILASSTTERLIAHKLVEKIEIENPSFGLEFESFGEHRECLEKIEFVHSKCYMKDMTDEQLDKYKYVPCEVVFTFSKVPKNGFIRVLSI